MKSLHTKLAIVGVILVIVLVVVFFARSDPQVDAKEVVKPVDSGGIDLNIQVGEPANDEDESVEVQESSGISITELATHSSEDDCWIVYDNKVYDITSYIPRHPGGEDKIIRNCGDPNTFEEEFTQKHGTSKVGLLMKVGTFIGDFDVVGELA